MNSLLTLIIIGFIISLILKRIAKIHANIDVIYNSEYNKKLTGSGSYN